MSAIDLSLNASPLPRDLDTPCVVVDLDRLTANAVAMQAEQDLRSLALRPHLKTAKSVEVARMVLDLGAVGITVATIGEAEVFAGAGVDDIFIAYPLMVRGPKAKRLAALSTRCRLSVGVDSVEGIAALAASGADPDRLAVVVEIDSGGRRTGVPPPDVVPLVDTIEDHGLHWVGAFTHGGHSYVGADRVHDAAQDEQQALATVRTAMASTHSIADRVWSVGSTPTARLANRPPVTEVRAGTYLFGDRHQAALGAVQAGCHALVVAATVVSRPRPGECVLDAGAKSLAKDKAAYVAGYGVITDLPGAEIVALYDHHATVRLADGQEPRLGQQVSIIPNHVCPVVNLTDRLYVVRDGKMLDVWEVATRGRN